jgi:uncharacterized repeat protein (TIGR03803 family)
MRSSIASLALGLLMLPATAASQTLQPVQVLDTFTKALSRPSGAPVRAPDGNFYGITDDAVYRLTPGGQVTVAARLSDGREAAGALVLGPDGALYGTTQRGGAGGWGTVFRFDPVTSEVRTLHAFDGAVDGIAPQAGLVVAGGFLYGVTSDDLEGPNRAAIFRTDPATGATTTRYLFPLPTPPQQPYNSAFIPTSPLTVAADGLLYGTTRNSAGGGALYRFDPASDTVTFVRQFTGASESPGGRLHRGPDDRLYGTLASREVYRFDPATSVYSVIHVLDPVAASIAGRLGPVVTGPDGTIYGTHPTRTSGVLQSILFRLRPAGGTYTYDVVHTFGETEFLSVVPVDFAVAADGLIYGSAEKGGPEDGGTIYRFDPASDPFQISVLHAFPQSTTTWGPTAPAPFSDGALYGLTTRGGANRRGAVYRLDPASGEVSIVGHRPALPAGDVAVFDSTLVDGLDGFLYGFSNVRVSPNGPREVRIVRVNPANGAVTVAVQAAPAEAGDVFFNDLLRMVRSSAGQLYFVSHGRVMRFDPTTDTLTAGGALPSGAQVDVTRLLAAGDGQVYLGVSIGEFVPGPGTFRRTARLMRLNATTLAVEDVVHLGNADGAPVTSLVEASDGALYLATQFQVHRVVPLDGAHSLACAIPSSTFLTSLTSAPGGRLAGLLLGSLTRTQSLLVCTPSAGVVEVRTLPPAVGALRGGWVAAGGLLYGATWDEPFAIGRITRTSARNLPQPAGALVRLSLDGPPPALDSDADGLPTLWETSFGLDPLSAGGTAGASGDADGDGRTNEQELADGTHPNGRVTRYFAEGATGAFFRTRLDIANPNGARPATVLLRFLTDAGGRLSHTVVLDAASRLSIDPSTLPGLAHAAFSTVIEADATIAASRTMTWDSSGYGSHIESGVVAPASTWYFAEGSTSGPFSLFYLLQNPHATAVQATIRYLRPFGLPIDRSYTLPPFSRTTIAVDGEGAELASTDVSAVVTAASPIVAERAMYYSRPGQLLAAGHESAGVTAPALQWFFAEGATGAFFDLFVLVANPNPTAAAIEVEYLLLGGGSLTKTYAVAANSRSTIWVDDQELPAGSGTKPLAATSLSMVVRSTNGVPVIAERTMWWPGPELATDFWYEAHNSPGATSTATRWVVAGAEHGGAGAAQTFLLIANPGATVARVRITSLADGTPTAHQAMDLPPRSRTSVAVGVGTTWQMIEGLLVESEGAPAAPIVVEMATYASPGGVTWAAGGNALATPLP